MNEPKLMEKIKVLDHGFVRVVDHMGSDLSIIRNARGSYAEAWRAGDDEGGDTRLMNYLYANGHNTPFEAVTMTFEVKAPIFVFRQWHRHRTQSYNELSARYRELPEEFYIPEAEVIGKQSKSNKQARDLSLEKLSDSRLMALGQIKAKMTKANQASFAIYKELLDNGIPRELARSVLPVATYSHMFATANLHNFFNFLRERMHPHAQYEIKVYADAMLEMVREICPVATAAFEKKMNE